MLPFSLFLAGFWHDLLLFVTVFSLFGWFLARFASICYRFLSFWLVLGTISFYSLPFSLFLAGFGHD
jgi:hypothetical protein